MIYGEGYFEKQNGQTSHRYLIGAPPELLLKMRLHSGLSRMVSPCTPRSSHESPPPATDEFFVWLFVSACGDKFFPEELSGYGGPNCPP